MIIDFLKRIIDYTNPGNDKRFLKVIGPSVQTATFDPGSIADGNEEATTITVTGAVLGDICMPPSFSLDLADLVLTGAVTAADTVTCVFANNTGGAIDLGSGTLKVWVVKASTT